MLVYGQHLKALTSRCLESIRVLTESCIRDDSAHPHAAVLPYEFTINAILTQLFSLKIILFTDDAADEILASKLEIFALGIDGKEMATRIFGRDYSKKSSHKSTTRILALHDPARCQPNHTFALSKMLDTLKTALIRIEEITVAGQKCNDSRI